MKPEQGGRIAALVQRGALEIGPWYVLSDLLIPSRRIAAAESGGGRRATRRASGRRLEVLYSPDAFGHPAELPALAAEFGIQWAVIRRGLGTAGRTGPRFYRWEAPGAAERCWSITCPPAVTTSPSICAEPRTIWRGWAADAAASWSTAPLTIEIAVFLGADHHAMVRDIGRLRDRSPGAGAGAPGADQRT